MKIGKKISKGFKKIGKGLKSVKKLGGKVFSTITKTLGKVLKPFGQIMGGLLNFLPGGQLLSGLASKFLGNPLGLQSSGVLGAMGSGMGALSSPSQLLGFSQQVSMCAAFQSPQGQANFIQLVAYQQARLL